MGGIKTIQERCRKTRVLTRTVTINGIRDAGREISDTNDWQQGKRASSGVFGNEWILC